jgi:acetolactate synthase-1/3 small subunit
VAKESRSHSDPVVRERAHLKVRASGAARAELLQLCELFRARVVDVHPGAVTLELVGSKDKLDRVIDVLGPYGIVEMARSAETG